MYTSTGVNTKRKDFLGLFRNKLVCLDIILQTNVSNHFSLHTKMDFRNIERSRFHYIQKCLRKQIKTELSRLTFGDSVVKSWYLVVNILLYLVMKNRLYLVVKNN